MFIVNVLKFYMVNLHKKMWWFEENHHIFLHILGKIKYIHHIY